MDQCILYKPRIQELIDQCILYRPRIQELMDQCILYKPRIQELMDQCILYKLRIQELMDQCILYKPRIQELMDQCILYKPRKLVPMNKSTLTVYFVYLSVFFNFVYLSGFFTDYSFEREHAGLRRIAGYGVTTTRGAASAMMFTYSALLVTMSRNTITFFRETFLHRFFPWDSMHLFHKYIAVLALLFTGN